MADRGGDVASFAAAPRRAPPRARSTAVAALRARAGGHVDARGRAREPPTRSGARRFARLVGPQHSVSVRPLRRFAPQVGAVVALGLALRGGAGGGATGSRGSALFRRRGLLASRRSSWLCTLSYPKRAMYGYADQHN